MRILTPLIKFRTTRDARKVTTDGMEVRGGCGYIEEWSDARVVRDAHLGSIWEGTSNIVALDVFRAIRREGTLPVLSDYLHRLIDASALAERERCLLKQVLDKAAQAAEKVAENANNEHEVRRIASTLYHATSAVFLAWEAQQQRDNQRRAALAALVLRYKLLPQDPTVIDDVPAEHFAELLAERPMVASRVAQLIATLNLPEPAAGQMPEVAS